MSQPGRRLYTLAEARALLPEVLPVLERLCARIAELHTLEAEIKSTMQRTDGNGHLPADPWRDPPEGRFAELERQLIEDARRLDAWSIELKDPVRGLIDFRSRRDDGEVVYLCYELGEPDIAYWHRLDDGYAGRQAL